MTGLYIALGAIGLIFVGEGLAIVGFLIAADAERDAEYDPLGGHITEPGTSREAT